MLRLRALSLGVITAVLLVTAFTFVSTSAASSDGAHLVVPLEAEVAFAAWLSAIYALVLAALCAPIWMLLVKRGRDTAVLAATLGFVAPLALWILINLNGYAPLGDMLVRGLPYGVCGAAAGLITWWAAPRA